MSKIQDRPLPNPELLRAEGISDAVLLWLRHLTQTLTFIIFDIRNIQNSGKQTILQLDVLENEPENPQDGMVVYADGTSWNPGSGRGIYERRSSAWHKL